MEWLLKIKGAVFFPGTPFLSKICSLVLHFGPQSGPRNCKKGNQKLYSKIYKKGVEKYSKMMPKWLPKSTPGGPKWLPDVCHLGPHAFKNDPFSTPSGPGGALWDRLGTQWDRNGPQKRPLGSQSDLPGDAKSPSGCSLGSLGVAAAVVLAVLLPSLLLCGPCSRCRRCLFCAVVAVLKFLAMICSSLPRALDSITHRHDCSPNRAGGMRGAIE